MAKATKEELLNIIYEHGFDEDLKKKVFAITNAWSWPRQIIRFLNRYNSGFYKFGEHLFSSRFGNEIYSKTGLPWSQTPFDEFTIGKLLELFVKVKDPNISFSARENVISKLDQYLRNNFPQLKSYEDVINKPVWLLGKALQRVLSNKEGSLLSLNDIGIRVLHDSHAFTSRYDSERQMNRLTYQGIVDYCKENLQNSDDINYIDEMVEALAYAQGDIVFTSSNPKEIELALIQKIAKKLAVLKNTEHWRGDIPNFHELANFFGESLTWLWSKTHMSETRIHNIFFEKDIDKISNALKSKLHPVDKAGCQELLLELGNYDSDARQAELRKLFPTYKDWQGYEGKAIIGDSDSTLPANWQSLRNRAKSLFYSEQGEHVVYKKRSDGTSYPVSYVFDAFTGRVYEKDIRGWELHHIDFDETNNDFDNFLWVMKFKDPDTGRSSHQTVFSSEFDHKEYIALGRMIKTAFKHGYAPRSWSYERQAYYYEVLREQQRRFITN